MIYISITLLVPVSCGKYFFSPNCPNISTQTNFSMNRFVGTWFEESCAGAAKWWFPGRCHTIQFDPVRLQSQGIEQVAPTEYVVFLRQLFKWLNKPLVRAASLQLDGAKLKINYNLTLGPFTHAVSVPYWILNTDYQNWALIWSCVEKTFRVKANAYILTRSRESLDSDAEKELEAALIERKLTRKIFKKQNQEDCLRYHKLLMNTEVNV